MHLSYALLSTLFTFGMSSAAQLPYAGLLTPEQETTYMGLVGLVENDELASIIRLDLIMTGVIREGDETPGLGETYPQEQEVVIPVSTLPYQYLMSNQEIAIWQSVAAALGPEELLETIQERLGTEGRIPEHHGPDGPLPEEDIHAAVLQNALMIGSMYYIVNGAGQAHHVMVAQGQDPNAAALHYVMTHDIGPGPYQLAQFSIDPQAALPDPFSMTEEEFTEFAADPAHFNLDTFQAILANANLGGMSAERIFRIMTASAQHGSFEVFSFFRKGMFKALSSESGPALDGLLQEITKEGQDPRFLENYLEECSPVVANEVGKLMNPANSSLHQVFVNKCYKSISSEVVSRLHNIEMPESLKTRLANVTKNGRIMSVHTISGMTDVKESGVLAVVKPLEMIQVCGFFSDPDVAKDLNHLRNMISVDSLYQALSIQPAHISFCVVHLDFIAGVATIFKGKKAGPAIGILHVDPADNSAVFTDGLDAFYSHDQSEVCMYTEKIQPNDVIIGVSEAYLSNLASGFKQGVLNVLSWSCALDTVPTIVNYLTCCFRPELNSRILVGIVPNISAAATEITEIKEEKELDEDEDKDNDRN